MTPPLILTLLWFVAANGAAMLPTRGNRRKRAVLLVVVGVPLLGWLTAVHGPVAGILALAAGTSVLRWPIIHVLRRAGYGLRRGEPAE
ncbi:hypothetical protein ruthe_00815 [Rubellimicrobium thermophilum DSM 16684]|uniref:DUF2484 family protein n=2 Tax=Rubellimicrobium TaxID=295418 RepID=S9SLA3_9RHOB|nr:DUF2484 family protein [Rubellimicrobium thermophilum]EPX87144.1 hypothetical protein ruthe_00815 [Rubellimicrobium thermophilum DSM 16684]